MASAFVASATLADLTATFPDLLVIQANEYPAAIEQGSPFLLLGFPPSARNKLEIQTPGLWEETGALSLRYHVPSGSDLQPARQFMDGLIDHFTNRAFPADLPPGVDFPIHTEGPLGGYESDEPVGNWFEMHVAVPFFRRYMR
jgi:hypothetical protein